ncbi:MAG TPA: triose-phosphate isomerase, partial [Candidatus Omnitrophota bacterium]|nr:triose-phosphate isomerase [Candidatus Omnitrophota bacterium]
MGNNIFDKDRGLAIPVFAIPDNIGGRYSVRSPGGDITSEFAGIDTSRFNKGARDALDKYLSYDPAVNIALQAALEAYSINPYFLNAVVPSWKLMAFGDHLAQLIPESDSKSNKGQVVKVYLERLMDKAGNGIFDNKTVTIKIIVGGARSGVYFEKDNRIITYALADYSEEELAKMFFFFEEFTVRLGLFYIGEETGDIYSESFLRADPLTQGFVELGKAVVARFATEASAKGPAEGRYRGYEKKIGKGPLVDKISLFTSGKKEDSLPDYAVAAIPKEAVNISDEALLKAVKEIEGILNQEFVSEADEARLAKLLESVKGYGRGRQGRFIENSALTLARLAFYEYKKSKLIWPLFYGSNLLQQKALGVWYKYIAPALRPEFGVGTTRQHSYFEGGFGGAEVYMPLFVDVVSSLDEIRKFQEPLKTYGLARDYLNGLYDDEILRLYLEAQAQAFSTGGDISLEQLSADGTMKRIKREVEVKRDNAILRLKGLASDLGRIQAYRLFGRFTELFTAMIEQDALPKAHTVKVDKKTPVKKQPGTEKEETKESAPAKEGDLKEKLFPGKDYRRPFIIAGNQKAFSRKEFDDFYKNIPGKVNNEGDSLLFTPFERITEVIGEPVNLRQMVRSAENLFVGAQDICGNGYGAYTGQTPAEEVKRMGGEFVLLGLADRANYLGEKNSEVAQK